MITDDELLKCSKCKQLTTGALYGHDQCWDCYQIDYDANNDQMED